MNGTLSGVCVGNGFIRSETSVNTVVRWMVTGSNFFPTIIHSTYLGKNVADVECINAFPTKRINIFPFNAPAQNHYPGGMHKCIPYELFVNKGIILLMKADKQNAKMHGKKEDSG